MDNVQLEIEPPAALITLNRPEVRNAISPAMLTAFHKVLDRVEDHQEVAVVIVTGAGKAFCSGADLSVLQEMTGATVEEMRRDSARLMRLYRRLYEFPRPVIAAVNGAAFGGGCGLATVCDITVSSREAWFAYSECRVGFVPALVAVFLARISGEKAVRELLLTARSFSADEAREYGLVNYVVEPEELLPKARELANMISRNSPTSLRLTKQLVADLYGLNLEAGLAMALQLNTLVRNSEDFQEGISSFLEKRVPEWKGR